MPQPFRQALRDPPTAAKLTTSPSPTASAPEETPLALAFPAARSLHFPRRWVQCLTRILSGRPAPSPDLASGYERSFVIDPSPRAVRRYAVPGLFTMDGVEEKPLARPSYIDGVDWRHCADGSARVALTTSMSACFVRRFRGANVVMNGGTAECFEKAGTRARALAVAPRTTRGSHLAMRPSTSSADKRPRANGVLQVVVLGGQKTRPSKASLARRKRCQGRSFDVPRLCRVVRDVRVAPAGVQERPGPG